MYKFSTRTKQSGFTLIELLVVIAIIGILSAVVLGSLNDARQSAKDASIAQQVNSLAKMMELNSLEIGHSRHYTDADRSVWIRSDGASPTCDNITLAGLTTNSQTEFRKLCNAIQANSSYNGQYFMLLRWYRENGSFGPHYSFFARTGGNKVFCAGSTGGRYVGPLNPGTGNYTGSGCPLNP